MDFVGHYSSSQSKIFSSLTIHSQRVTTHLRSLHLCA
nr:MAG TPA: hypothetical protein [Caudoviricetes sp.]